MYQFWPSIITDAGGFIMHANVMLSGIWKVGGLHTSEAIAVLMCFTIILCETPAGDITELLVHVCV